MSAVSFLRVLAASAVLACSLGASVLGVGAGPDPASAVSGKATCPEQSVADQTRNARAVFTGTVTGATSAVRTDGQRGELLTHTVTVERVYQGRVRSDMVTVQTDRIPRVCTVGALDVGVDYVFFVEGDGEPWIAAGGAGTAPASAELVASVEQLLGAGRAPVAPERESATFTDLDLAAPTPLTRLAAPGAALILIGLLGLLVAGRFGRRA